MNRKLAAFAAVLVFALLMTSAVWAQEDYKPTFEEADCLFEMENITCGYVVVPEDRSDPAGNQVELAVVIIHSWSEDPAPDPVIYLEGGPGGSALFAVPDLSQHPILESRDIIAFDQRGTGFSLPSLNCPEDEAGEENGEELCRDRLLEEGVNLNAYNTPASAADVRDLGIALGYDEVNLWGISYGTKLALTTMRDWPEGIRSVIIDSVYPPEIDDLGLTPIGFVGAYEELFARCAADEACSEAYPDLESDFYTIIDQYNAEPVTVETDDGETEISGDEILAQFFLALYDSTLIPYLPHAITLMAYAEDDEMLLEGYDLLTGAEVPNDNRQPSPFYIEDSPLVQSYTGQYGDVSDSEGMNLSFDCSEEYQLNDADAAYANAEAAPEPLVGYFVSGIESALAGCEAWGVQTADPIESERVISDIPTLVVSGAIDPVTPPSSGESAAEGLSNAQFVLFPTAGHGITFTNNEAGECAKSLVVAFLDDPFAELDTTCVDETNWIEFYTGE